MEQTLRKYLYGSATAHLIVAAALIVSPFHHLSLHEEKIVWVELPKGVSMSNAEIGAWLKKSVGLPKTTIEEQKRALEKPKEAEKKPEMTYKKERMATPRPAVPKTVSEEEKRMKEALARVGKEVAARKVVVPEAAQIPETRTAGVPFGIPTGSTVPPTDPEYVLYQAKVRQRIMDQWILPLKFSEPSAEPGLGLICQIIVRINERGEVLETQWERQSGNPAFDLSAVRAIEKASPLDPPPERLKGEALREGFLVEFNPQQKTP